MRDREQRNEDKKKHRRLIKIVYFHKEQTCATFKRVPRVYAYDIVIRIVTKKAKFWFMCFGV